MALEMVLLAAAFAGIDAFGLYRRGHRVFPENNHQENLMCIVTFFDRAQTLPLIEAYFEENGIEVRNLKREMKRDGDDTIYEMKISWKELTGGYVTTPKLGDTLGFSALINDNDGEGRRGYMEYGSGIGGNKNPGEYGIVSYK